MSAPLEYHNPIVVDTGVGSLYSYYGQPRRLRPEGDRPVEICPVSRSLLCSETSTNQVWSSRFDPLGAPRRWTTKGICGRDERSHSRESHPSLAVGHRRWRVAGDAAAFVHNAR